MRSSSPLAGAAVAALMALATPSCAAASSDIPAWLDAYVGEGDGQIAATVLRRARALYKQRVVEGAVRNPCYFAMDATRPNDPASGRFYIVCEAEHSFRAVAAGHGGGRDLKGIADFSNGRTCAKNFGNAADSDPTTGGAYVTGETKASFKGYYRTAANGSAAFVRSFLQFDGEGETANARARAIGGHAAVALKGVCLRKDAASPYANADGYVPFGNLVDYSGGRSNGCTSWSAADARQIMTMVTNEPTTLYIYPEAGDIDAIARAVASGRPGRSGAYWNMSCLKQIRAPHFWSRERLEPMLAQYRRDNPPPPPRPTPLCRGE